MVIGQKFRSDNFQRDFSLFPIVPTISNTNDNKPVNLFSCMDALFDIHQCFDVLTIETAGSKLVLLVGFIQHYSFLKISIKETYFQAYFKSKYAIMDSTKYTVPNLPTPQHILEDLSDPAIIRPNQPLNLPAEEETLRNAYENFVNCKQLEEDLSKHSELSSNLEELNKKLVENIECMKAHAK